VRLIARAFWVPKFGATEDEYEDAFSPRSLRSEQEYDARTFRIAVADGATEASFARQWAGQLARAYCRAQLRATSLRTDLSPLQDRWQAGVADLNLPWYAEEKARAGAAAAIVGLHLRDTKSTRGSGVWNAVAVGDCCLFQIRDDALLTAFPLSHSDDFTNSPFLVPSLRQASTGLEAHLSTVAGDWQTDDAFYLMSDAAAAWFLRGCESQRAPWRMLRDVETSEGPRFVDLIDDLRATDQLRNDDVTVVRLELVG